MPEFGSHRVVADAHAAVLDGYGPFLAHLVRGFGDDVAGGAVGDGGGSAGRLKVSSLCVYILPLIGS